MFFFLLFNGVNFYELSCWCLSLTSAASALAAVTALTNERARTCALTAADLSKLSTIVGWVLLQVARAHPRGFLRKLRVVVGGGGGGPKMDVWQLRTSCDSCCWQAGGGSGACVSIILREIARSGGAADLLWTCVFIR